MALYDELEKTFVRCPLCESTAFDTLCSTDRYLMGVRTAICTGCGLVMTNPMPTAAALERFYEKDYRSYYRKLDRPDSSFIRRYALDERAALSLGYLRSRRLLEPGTRVLDFGCGEGSLLRLLSKCRRVEAEGVEVCEPFRVFARNHSGFPVFSRIEEVELRPAEAPPYDLILLSHVLEHLPEPVSMLRRLARLLRPNGRFLIDVPDLCRYRWLADLHLAHVYHFSLRTLAGAVHAAGLEVEAWSSHRPPKLPHCVRVLAGRGVVKAPIPELAREEQLAASRVRGMHRAARTFHLAFTGAMFAFEKYWSLRSRSGLGRPRAGRRARA